MPRSAQLVVWRGMNVDGIQQLLIVDCLLFQGLLPACLLHIIQDLLGRRDVKEHEPAMLLVRFPIIFASLNTITGKKLHTSVRALTVSAVLCLPKEKASHETP